MLGNEEKINKLYSDKRKYERKDTITTIEYRVNGTDTDEVFEGVISNISESGFCLLSTNPLSKNEKIKIKNDQHIQPREASVRWSSKCNSLYFRIGLEFV